MYGCFSNLFRLDKGLYHFITVNNLFTYAIDEFTVKGREVNSLATYALWEWHFLKKEATDNSSILYKVIHNRNYEQLEGLIQISKTSKWLNTVEKIFIVKELLKVISNSEAFNAIYAKLLWLLEDVDELNDEIADLANIISRNLINSSHTLYYYMKHIFKTADSDLPLAGDIVTTILKNKYIVAPYDQGLVVFVNKLYDAGYKGAADEICILVSEKNPYY
ncbi:MAG: hypothetical protein WKG06_04310 [Segetibacter sp.]